MLFKSISFNSTKSFEANVEALCKKNGSKQTICTVNPRPPAQIHHRLRWIRRRRALQREIVR